MKKVTASAPGKLMLSGSYAVVHGRPSVVTAVDQRLFVSVEINGNDQFHLEAPDLGLTAYTKTIDELGAKDLPKSVRFVETLYKLFLEEHPQERGIKVRTKSEFACTFGFGSSSAVTVAFAKALMTLYGFELSNKELFDLCYKAVIKVQGVGSGFDLAAAIWGGTIYYVSPAIVVDPIEMEDLPIVVGYTGIKADTPTLVRMINGKLERETPKIESIFEGIGEVSQKMLKELQGKNWQEVGSALNQHQSLMRQLGVSSHELEDLIDASVKAGAYGAGLSGAGGGDCMLAVVNEDTRAQVEQAIVAAGGRVMDVKLNAHGVKLEK